jgi:hypothetical protein
MMSIFYFTDMDLSTGFMFGMNGRTTVSLSPLDFPPALKEVIRRGL